MTDLLSLLVYNVVSMPCWCAIWSSLLAGALPGLLSMLVRIMVFFPCCCKLSFTNFLLKILPWQPRKMATGHKTHNLVRQSSNDHNCQLWFNSLHVLWRKYNLPFSIVSLVERTVVIATKQKTDHHNFSYF